MGVVLFGCQGPAPVHPGGLWVYCHWPILYKKKLCFFGTYSYTNVEIYTHRYWLGNVKRCQGRVIIFYRTVCQILCLGGLILIPFPLLTRECLPWLLRDLVLSHLHWLVGSNLLLLPLFPDSIFSLLFPCPMCKPPLFFLLMPPFILVNSKVFLCQWELDSHLPSSLCSLLFLLLLFLMFFLHLLLLLSLRRLKPPSPLQWLRRRKRLHSESCYFTLCLFNYHSAMKVFAEYWNLPG